VCGCWSVGSRINRINGGIGLERTKYDRYANVSNTAEDCPNPNRHWQWAESLIPPEVRYLAPLNTGRQTVPRVMSLKLTHSSTDSTGQQFLFRSYRARSLSRHCFSTIQHEALMNSMTVPYMVQTIRSLRSDPDREDVALPSRLRCAYAGLLALRPFLQQ